MGLDFHVEGDDEFDTPHWNWSSFSEFVRTLIRMDGRVLPENNFTPEDCAALESDPLGRLLHGSVMMSADECRQTVSCLRELLEREDAGDFLSEYDLTQGRMLVAAMERVVELGTYLEFC